MAKKNAVSNNRKLSLSEAAALVKSFTESTDTCEFLDLQGAAAFLKKLGVPYSERTLKNFRANRTGPKTYKFGHAVRYSRKDLLAWVESHRQGGAEQ